MNVIKDIAGKVVVFIGGLAFVFTMLWFVGGFDVAKAIFGLFTTMFTSICNAVFAALF